MKEERTTPLRARMIEDMRIRGMGDAHKVRLRELGLTEDEPNAHQQRLRAKSGKQGVVL